MRGNGTKVDIDELEGFIAAQMRAQLAGIRIESVDTGKERGFIDYDEDGISIVRPDTPVRVVLFGWELDEVVMVGFTATRDCGNTLRNHTHFITQTETRLVVQQMFPDLGPGDVFKICMKMRPRESKNGETVESPFALIDSEETSISAAAPPRKYHFPLPIQIAILAVLLVFSGLFAGLTLGLMGLTPQELMLISKSGSKREKKYAETILPVRKQGNFLLCSLVLGNVMVNSSISILFDDLTSGTVALVLSTVGIVVFGEIFPQSVCVKKGLAVGARTIWITRLIMAVTLPVAWPVSKFLDYVLGDEVATYDRRRLIELIKLSTRNEDGLAEELKIAVGAMELSDKTVADVMTRID
ncbi:ancient conserved domain protein 4 [Aphelenchoides avenae]|nr:ancient conserved domain protein 4 [Aphelenchus avenae]